MTTTDRITSQATEAVNQGNHKDGRRDVLFDVDVKDLVDKVKSGDSSEQGAVKHKASAHQSVQVNGITDARKINILEF